MVKTSGNASKKPSNQNIFIIEDLPKIRQVIKQIELGISSERKAADQFNVTRHIVRKWRDYFREQNAPSNEKEPDILFRQKVVREVYQKQLRRQDACKKFDITLDTLRRWLKSMPGMVVHKSARRVPDEQKIEEKEKKEIAHKVQLGDISQFKAAQQLNVTRYTIRKWIYNYPVFNLEGNIKYHVMTPEEKAKQLEKEIERLKKELENEKLRNEGLQTLIEVAEEKFNIKIKKKPGSHQPPK